MLAALPGLKRLVGRAAAEAGNGAVRRRSRRLLRRLPSCAALEPAPRPRSPPDQPAAEPRAPPRPSRSTSSAPSPPRSRSSRRSACTATSARSLDPLGSEPPGDPALEPESLDPPLTPEVQARIPASVLRLYVEGDTLLEALPQPARGLHGHDRVRDRAHLGPRRARLASPRDRVGSLSAAAAGRGTRELLLRLAQVEAFETYLRRAFIGQKQFSIEGLDALVPMLDEAVELGAAGGAHEVVIGIAHRGRLNVLAHTVGRSYASILREFEGERSLDALVADPEGGTGDVKYHLSASESRMTEAGEVQVTLAANPSHLEAVDPVVEGLARAEQTDRSAGAGIHDPTVALPILIHGDASFAGQGVVAETFNLLAVEGYTTGGTLHVIANNQIGFTTDPTEGRSTRYASDLAKGFDIADHPRERRRPGGRARGDPARTRVPRRVRPRRRRRPHRLPAVRPQRAGRGGVHAAAHGRAQIEQQPPVRESYAARLVAEGVLSEEEAATLLERTLEALRDVHDQLRASFAEAGAAARATPAAGHR